MPKKKAIAPGPLFPTDQQVNQLAEAIDNQVVDTKGKEFIEEAYKHAIGKDQILALDIATKTGFATSTASGVWNFTPKKDESKGMRLIRFRTKIVEMLRKHGFKFVVFEGAAVFGKHPNFVAAEMVGVLKITCEEHGVEYMAYVPASIKKFATGKGNAGKPVMIEAARRRWGMESNDENEADALALFHYTLESFGLEEQKTII